jgi:hypothetical protein
VQNAYDALVKCVRQTTSCSNASRALLSTVIEAGKGALSLLNLL